MLNLSAVHRTRVALGRVGHLGFEGAPGLVGAVSGVALTSAAILVVNLAGGIAQARGLGPAGRGSVAVAMAWPTLIGALGALGIQEAVAYRTARESFGRPRVLSTALVIGAAQTLLLAILCWKVLPLVLSRKPPSVLAETTFYMWILPLLPLVFYPVAFLQGRMAFSAYNGARFTIAAVSTAIVVGLWVSHRMTVTAALAASLISYAAAAALCFGMLAVRRELPFPPSRSLFRPLVWFGARVQLGNLATIVAGQRVDLLVLSVIVSAPQLGLYAVATTVGAVAYVLPSTVGVVLYPAFARQKAAALPDSLAKVLLTGGILTLLSAPVICIVIPLIVPVVYGPAFKQAVFVSALLSVGYFIRGWNLVLAQFIRASGRPFTASAGQAVELVLLVTLLLAVVPRFGINSAGVSVVAGAGASLICLLMLAKATARVTISALLGIWVRDLRRWPSHMAAFRRAVTVAEEEP